MVPPTPRSRERNLFFMMSDRNRWLTALVPMLAIVCLSGCARLGVEGVWGYEGEEHYGEGREHHGERGHLGIPPGHLPPPGSCRVWYPGDPPGQQPPPGPCAQLAHEVPPGAWLLRRPRRGSERVYVDEYHSHRRGVRIGIRIYDAETGAFISAELP